ncbi:hypothetical protein BD311DRAFT_397208 [Dichomitus squalens]|uniref:Uncharacterized protein n=1 Tax=Dichomitus squalens TaxID=114155 RepID=A0A4Q9N0B5_9APHY|nr:hypothetical protein BD311DRAFT_397208 [Dichomitus squalens]
MARTALVDDPSATYIPVDIFSQQRPPHLLLWAKLLGTSIMRSGTHRRSRSCSSGQSVESGHALLAGRSLDMHHAVAFTPCTRDFGPPCVAEARGHTLAGYDGNSPYMPKVNVATPEDPWTDRLQLLLQSVTLSALDDSSRLQASKLQCDLASGEHSRLRLHKVADWPLITCVRFAWDRRDLPTCMGFSPDGRTLWWGTRGGMVHSRTLCWHASNGMDVTVVFISILVSLWRTGREGACMMLIL